MRPASRLGRDESTKERERVCVCVYEKVCVSLCEEMQRDRGRERSRESSREMTYCVSDGDNDVYVCVRVCGRRTG
jgi:hypothetical protein